MIGLRCIPKAQDIFLIDAQLVLPLPEKIFRSVCKSFAHPSYCPIMDFKRNRQVYDCYKMVKIAV